MLKAVITRLVNVTAACHLQCVHPTSLSLSSLQSRIRTSNGVATSATRREMPENVAGGKTPSFQYFWKPGSCYYGESLGRVNKSAIDLCDEFVFSHIDLAPVSSPKGVFTIGDFGTCDGSMSLELMHKIIDHLRKKHGPDLKIQIVYQDQPHNDYNSLFKKVYDEASYMTKFTNVFPLACATSFYKQCVPDTTCDIIVTTFATHYLSEQSHVRCASTIFPWRSTSEEEVRAHREAAARDWQTFLLLRAAELKQGGLLFVLMPAQNKESNPSQARSVTVPATDNVSCTHKETARDVWSYFDLSWNEFYAKGLITKEEFQSCTIAMAFRTLQELKAPFENAIFPVRQAGLNLLKEPEEFFTACYAKKMWRQNLETCGVDDRKLFAQLLSKGFGVVLNGTLRNTFRNTRSAEKQSAILQEYYECFVQKVASVDPETFQSELFVSRLVAQKLK